MPIEKEKKKLRELLRFSKRRYGGLFLLNDFTKMIYFITIENATILFALASRQPFCFFFSLTSFDFDGLVFLFAVRNDFIISHSEAAQHIFCYFYGTGRFMCCSIVSTLSRKDKLFSLVTLNSIIAEPKNLG